MFDVDMTQKVSTSNKTLEKLIKGIEDKIKEDMQDLKHFFHNFNSYVADKFKPIDE